MTETPAQRIASLRRAAQACRDEGDLRAAEKLEALIREIEDEETARA